MISADQSRQLREEGFLLVRNALPCDKVAGWRKAWIELKGDIEAGRSQVRRADRFILDPLPPPLADIYREGALVSIAQDVLGPDVALYFLRMLVKDARWSGPVATHQDMPYFHGGQVKLSAFVPLEPFTQAKGALKFVTGSNRFGNLGVRGTIDHSLYPQLPVAAPEAEPGDVLLADFHVWHYSDAATEPGDRPILQIVYQPASDGSYYGLPVAPTLVCGEWRTTFFSKYGDSIAPDVPPRGDAEPPARSGLLRRLLGRSRFG